jgi:PAS domain S-box-containing protein
MRDTGQPLLIEDTHVHPDWTMVNSTNWTGSYIGAPIRVDNVVIGFMNVNNYATYKFRTEHVQRVVALTEQVAVAIRNARLYEAARRSADELAERVIERTAELEEQRAQLEAILNSITDGVVSSSVSDTGVIQPRYINHALQQMLGYSLTDWYPNLIQEAIISDDTPEQLYQQALTDLLQRGRWSGEVTLRRRDGSIFNAYIETVRISSGERVFSGVVTVVRDISQQKALEEQKSRFVANASHELRTPITNLITRLWLLRRQPEKLDEHLDILDDVANRIRRLVIDLLDLSRFERGLIPLQREAMDIVPVIQSVVNLQRPEAERKHVRLLADLPEKPLIVLGDSERIHQVITNLVTNAIHYTPEGGQVRVYTTGPLHPDEKRIAIHVEDSGIGIAPEHVPNLFQPFYRAGAQHSGGTGLGLTIAREIIVQHDGDILVNSQPGAGSTFTVRLRLIE